MVAGGEASHVPPSNALRNEASQKVMVDMPNYFRAAAEVFVGEVLEG